MLAVLGCQFVKELIYLDVKLVPAENGAPVVKLRKGRNCADYVEAPHLAELLEVVVL